MMIDSSGSQRTSWKWKKKWVAPFWKDPHRKDEAFVISFDVNVDLLQDFTRDAPAFKPLNKAKINTDCTSGGIPGMGGGPVPRSATRPALLYDAVYLASHDMLSRDRAQGNDPSHRRAGRRQPTEN